MDLGEIIAIIVVAVIIGLAVFYIIKAKKNGQKCIGCPNGCANCKASQQKKDVDQDNGCRCCNCREKI